jgi:hypothetical protein
MKPFQDVIGSLKSRGNPESNNDALHHEVGTNVR